VDVILRRIGPPTLNEELLNPQWGTPRRDTGQHPVLARLPDIGSQPPVQPRSARAAAGFVDYRFDMPASEEEPAAHGRHRVQPPAFKRSPRIERRPRSAGGASRALPGSNPFAIPAASLVDRLAPVVRFLAMFLIFTAVGTFVLSTTRERASEPKPEQVPSASAPTDGKQLEPAQALEPTQMLEPTTNVDHPTIASPKVFGPLGANADKDAFELPPFPEIESEETSEPKADEERLPSLAGANGEPLPQVRTTEMAATSGHEEAAAPARLTGSIQPSEDASSDELRKPPAVARLPSIFEAPRNAYQ
jgi:hypothetical protein